MKAFEGTFGRISMQLFAILVISLYATLSALPLVASAQSSQAATALTATPTSGRAPLPVTFTGRIYGGSGTLNFGDGTSVAIPMPSNAVVGEVYTFPIQAHTYKAAGTYTAVLTDPDTTARATISVSAQTSTSASTKPTCQILVKPTSINIGGSVTVKWTSTNATAGAITNIGNVGPNGSINLLPSSAAVTTYFGAFTGPGGTANCQASVAVNAGAGSGGGATAGSAGTIDPSLTNTPSALGVPATLPSGQGSSGLVPCGYGAFTGGNEQGSSTGCQACSLVQLIQNIITFAIGIAIPIAAALFAYAGFLYITSASNPANIGKAKSIFKDALIGFLIAITAWLIINTLLHIVFSQGAFSGGNWFTIQCSTNNRPVNNKITDVLAKLPIVAGNTGDIAPDGSGGVGGIDASGAPTIGNGSGNTSGSSYNNTLDTLSSLCDTNRDAASCNAANQFADTGKLTTAVQDVLSDSCDDGSTASCNILNSSLVSSSGGRVTNPQMAAQIATACAQYGNCAIAQSIALNESGGGANCTTSYTGAAGCMQVLATTACRVDPTISSDCSSCLASGNSINPQCAPVIQAIKDNPQVGTNLGVQYINQLQNMKALQPLQQQYGACQITAAAYYQGPGNVLKAGGVPANAVSYVNKACG